MALQFRIADIPEGAQWTRINAELGLVRSEGELVVVNAGGPVFRCPEEDKARIRLIVAILASDGRALPKDLARAFGIDRSMVFEYRKRFQQSGAAALEDQPTTPKDAPKLKGEALAQAQALLDAGRPNTQVATAVGVTEGAIRAALRTGRLKAPEPNETSAQGSDEETKSPRTRNEEDRAGPGGMAVKRHVERGLAATGQLAEAPPVFVAAEGVAKGGVLVALPALMGQGLLEAGEEVYGSLKNGFFGLRSILLVLAFMALLRIGPIRQLRAHGPGELGLLLGLDRVPEEKTVRRKLQELAARKKATELVRILAERWVDETCEVIGLLYIDAHVRAYHGSAHELPKTKVGRLSKVMPATSDFWVHDGDGNPIFFLTVPANDHMLEVINTSLLREIKELLGGRRLTLALDREAWSPDQFQTWYDDGVDVITYRKGPYEPWPESEFEEVTVQRRPGRRPKKYRFAEREITLSNGFRMREVRRLRKSGKQTSIVTTCRDLSMVQVAIRMFARWSQENFFRYARIEYGLDHNPTQAVEPADPHREVPNPKIKEKNKTLAKLSARLAKLERRYVALTLPDPQADTGQEPDEPPKAKKKSPPDPHELARQIVKLRRECETLKSEIADLPERVPVRDTRNGAPVVQLERERKTLVDTIKTAAYRAETELALLVGPALGIVRQEEARNFLKRVFQSTVDLLPDYENQRLVIRLYGLATRADNRVLAGLCDLLNRQAVCYPGTDLRLVYQPPESDD